MLLDNGLSSSLKHFSISEVLQGDVLSLGADLVRLELRDVCGLRPERDLESLRLERVACLGLERPSLP